ncbi:MAG: CRISPR-associated endonuclease Cas2 [Candidatus Anstonellaceae archaeon]
MYLIVVYDVGEKRVNKIRILLKTYLTAVQNSVFEGELTEKQVFEMKEKIKKIIDLKFDSVRVYKIKTKKFVKKEVFGVCKGDSEEFII